MTIPATSEFKAGTYRPGTYPDTAEPVLYQVAYAFDWGHAYGSHRANDTTEAECATFARGWARTPHAEREPLPVAHAAWLREVTTERLESIMEFDHVIRVHADGTVTDNLSGVHAPELHEGELMQGGTSGTGWTLMDGYSGQCGYSGPMMHQSEYVGGGLARDIMSAPGMYVTLVNYPADGSEPTEWAIARREV